MGPTNKTYPIKTINDLLAVPAERREICLMEIAVGLEQAERAAELGRIKPQVSHFQWVDDGKFTATFTLLHAKGSTTMYSPDWRSESAKNTEGNDNG